MVEYPEKEHYDFSDLRRVMRILRAPDGCPWDREQTHESIRNDLLEETYEVADAIDRADPADLCEELGDLLMNVVFHADLAEDAGDFTLDDVADGVVRKMIYRHPHVFGNVTAQTTGEVLNNWDTLKRAEKSQETFTDTLRSVPRAFPALMRAKKVQKRAAKAGFDWPDAVGAWDKLEEELRELRAAEAAGDPAAVREELGDLLFSVVNVSRFLKVDAEQALAAATDKFIDRFAAVEALAARRGVDMGEASLEALDALWDEVKKQDP